MGIGFHRPNYPLITHYFFITDFPSVYPAAARTRGAAGKSLCRGLIILSILAWCAYVSGDGPRQVNCEVYVYHPNCRGMQAKKRFMTSAENDKADPACPCGNSKKLRNNELDKLANSKLLEAMLAKGFDVDLLYDAYVATVDRRRNYNLNRDRPNRGGSKSLPKDGSTDFSNTEIVEDY